MKWTPHKLLEIPSDEEIAAMEPEELVSMWKIREEAIANEARDKYRYGFKFSNWNENDTFRHRKGGDDIVFTQFRIDLRERGKQTTLQVF